MVPTWQDIVEMTRQYRVERIEYWLHDVLFSSEWWILFITAAALFLIWLLTLDKKRIFEIICYGLMVAIIANLGDTLGLSFFLWGYQHSILHTPEILEIHNLMMPMIYMMVYQYFRTWPSFLIAAAVTALVFAFILEPLLVWLQIYELYRWKYYYSVVPYFVIAAGCKWIINQLKKWDWNYQ